jgi:hypothetical protein
MASQKIRVVQNDNNIKLIFTIKKDGTLESLSGAIVSLQFINKAAGYSMTRLCTITDASVAECEYSLTDEDLAQTGSFLTELTVEYLNGTKLTSQNPIILIVTPELVQ